MSSERGRVLKILALMGFLAHSVRFPSLHSDWTVHVLL